MAANFDFTKPKLARRLLELETRREQIEALEESFKRDKERRGVGQN